MNTINIPELSFLDLSVRSGLETLRELQNKTQESSMSIIERDDIPAYFPNGTKANFLESWNAILYPPQILEVLKELFQEYTQVFSRLVQNKTKEGNYCLSWQNCFIQIDMAGLPSDFLDMVKQGIFSHQELKEILRKSIFEMENSLAAYSLLRSLWDSQENQFWSVMNETLWNIRDEFRSAVVLATLTDEKHAGVLHFDAGIPKDFWWNIQLEIQKNTWFDDVFSPQDLVTAYKENSQVILYTRASLDRIWLANPNASTRSWMLDDIEFRKFLRAKSLTYNIDTPDDAENRLNDTKEYMPDIGMGYIISDIWDIISQDYQAYLSRNKAHEVFDKEIFTDAMKNFLSQQWLSSEEIESGQGELQCKPLLDTYGGYGQVAWSIRDGNMRSKLTKEMKKRKIYTATENAKSCMYRYRYRKKIYFYR